jgi:hypothetical protein
MSTAVQGGNVLSRSSETDDLDFKAEFHNKQLGEWLELIKDMVAFANSGGGTILIGLNDDGSPSGHDVSTICETDPADVTNKINSYTGIQFHAFDIGKAEKQGKEVCVLTIRSTRVPIVFTKVGNYEPSPGAKPKTAFNIGVVYFRHGAKSEPGNTEDLRKFVEREVEFVKKSWLSGIAKVVEAPPGSRVVLYEPESKDALDAEVAKFQLTDDPNALQILALRLDQTYPHRQKEVVTAVNQKLAGAGKITAFDAQCLNKSYSIKDNVKFCHTQKYASAQYSEQYVDWIVEMYQKDEEFFTKAKAKARAKD